MFLLIYRWAPPQLASGLGKQFNLMICKHLEGIFARRLEDVLKTSRRHLEDALKTLSQDFLKTSWQDVLKMSWRGLQNVLKTSWSCLEDVFARRLEDVLKTYGQDEYVGLDQDVFKTNIRQIYSSWWRRLIRLDEGVLMFAGIVSLYSCY